MMNANDATSGAQNANNDVQTVYVPDSIKRVLYRSMKNPDFHQYELVLNQRRDGSLYGQVEEYQRNTCFPYAERTIRLSRFRARGIPALTEEYEEWWGKQAFDALNDRKDEYRLVIDD